MRLRNASGRWRGDGTDLSSHGTGREAERFHADAGPSGQRDYSSWAIIALILLLETFWRAYAVSGNPLLQIASGYRS